MTTLRLEIDAHITIGAGALSVGIESSSQRLAIRGPSGTGKSSLLRALAGVDHRAAGFIAAFGETWQNSESFEFRPAHLRGVGWVPQDAWLFPHLSVAQNLAYGGATNESVDELAERLEVAHLLTRRPRHLSGGEAQRVALGRALCSSPRLLLLDEPFAALDDALRERVAAFLDEHCRDRDLPLVIASHDERLATALTEEAYRVRDGRLEPE